MGLNAKNNRCLDICIACVIIYGLCFIILKHELFSMLHCVKSLKYLFLFCDNDVHSTAFRCIYIYLNIKIVK